MSVRWDCLAGPCDVCGQDVDSCICPECSVCGEFGNPRCYASHGMQVSKEQARALESSRVQEEENAEIRRLLHELQEEVE